MFLLFREEFKQNRRSLFIWGSIIVLLSILMIAIFPAFGNTFTNFEELISTFPESFLNIFHLGGDGLDLTDAYGWYGMEGYLFILLVGGSYAAILGSSVLSREEDDKTIEFLLSKPISREKILLAKGLVVFANLVVINIILLVTNLIGFAIIEEVRLATILLMFAGPLLLQIIFASTSFAISVFVTKSRTVISISIGLVVGLFFLDIIAKLSDRLSFLKYLSPYEYVNALDIIKNNKIQYTYILLTIIIVSINLFISWFFYRKKDITI